MIRKEEIKIPLFLLIILTSIGISGLIAALVVSYIKGYVGLLMERSATIMCSVYLTYKLEYNNVDVLNMSFFGGCFGLLVGLLVLIQLIFLLVKYCKCE